MDTRRPFGLKRDVVIVGAGPAGSAAGLACAQNGLTATIVEALEFPRERPGETLPPAIEPLLQKLGAASILKEASYRRYQGISVAWNASTVFKKLGHDHRGEWQGFQAIRSNFDQRLLRLAKSKGIEVLQPCRATSLIREKGRTVGVQTDRGPLYSNYVLDASGHRQWGARQLKIEIERHSPPLLAQYGYLESKQSSLGIQPRLEADDLGWTWLTPIADRRYAWARLRYDGTLDSPTFASKAFSTLGETDRRKTSDVTWRSVQCPATSGYFCLGDAACVLDPLSSHGVLRAVMSAIMAVHCIALQRSARKRSKNPYTIYSHWLDQWYQNDLVSLREFYASIRKPPEWIQQQWPLKTPR